MGVTYHQGLYGEETLSEPWQNEYVTIEYKVRKWYGDYVDIYFQGTVCALPKWIDLL